MTFYGVIREIWEIYYITFQLLVFLYNQVDNNSGVREDELGFTLVNLNRIGHKSDHFILATEAKQVFYINDSLNTRWLITLGIRVINYAFGLKKS